MVGLELRRLPDEQSTLVQASPDLTKHCFGLAAVFEDLKGIDEVELARSEGQVDSVIGEELTILPCARSNLGRELDIDTVPLCERRKPRKEVNGTTIPAAEIEDPLWLETGFQSALKECWCRGLSTVITRHHTVEI
jgi:hypothetical protein